MICYKIAICVCSPKLSIGTMILFLPILRHVAAPWWSNTEINITEMLYPIDFMIFHKFAIHCVVNYEQEQWYYDFFQFLDMSLPPGGQIQKSIGQKYCTLVDFMICHKFAIHCACKLCKGTTIFIFFSIFRHIGAPWWPNTRINITEM